MTGGQMVIVGAGEAGARAATALREQGFDGSVTLVGDEDHFPYERPPLSKAAMVAELDVPPALILNEARLAALNIVHMSGVRAIHIDTKARQLQLEDGRTLPYTKLLIATGAGPRRLAVPGATDANVRYLRTFADALALRTRLAKGSRVVVIGGGFIGLEIAASASVRGCRVTLVETASRLLMRGVPEGVAEWVAARHRAAGVDLRVGVALHRIERRNEVELLYLSDGSVIESESIVAGVGAVPRTSLAEASGIEVENGVKADAHLRTSDPHVFAAGDCCSFPHLLYDDRRIRLEAWRNAQDQGNVAARNMLGGADAYAAVPWFWSDQFDETLQVTGLSDGAATTVDRDLGSARLFFHLAADGRLLAASGIGPNAAIAREIRLAEMLIAKRARPDPASLASPNIKLKTLLAT